MQGSWYIAPDDPFWLGQYRRIACSLRENAAYNRRHFPASLVEALASGQERDAAIFEKKATELEIRLACSPR